MLASFSHPPVPTPARLLSSDPLSNPRALSFPPCRSLHTPDASVETARFFPPVSSAPTFFTPFFSPLQRLPMRRSPAIGNTASSIRFVSLSPTSHIRTRSPFLSPVRLSSALFLLPRSSTSHPRSLLFSFIFPCLRAVPRLLSFGFFFHDYPTTYRRRASASFFYRDALLDHRLGHVLTYTRASANVIHIYKRTCIQTRTCNRTCLTASARGRDDEIKKGVKRELGCGRKRRVTGCTRRAVGGWCSTDEGGRRRNWLQCLDAS